MPPPLRNPNWTPHNGQPEWISYGPPNPNYVGQDQSNMAYSTRGAQPRRVASTGITPNPKFRPILVSPHPFQASQPLFRLILHPTRAFYPMPAFRTASSAQTFLASGPTLVFTLMVRPLDQETRTVLGRRLLSRRGSSSN